MSLSNESSRILPALDDIFQGKCVLHDQLPECEETFKLMLEESLLHWTQNKVRGVWLTIPSEKASFIPIAIENKFVFHHAKPHYVTLTRWLPQDEQNKLPNYAFTHVGVGGFVLNEKNELLVVREKYAHQTASWKIPGGLVEAGESLIEAAIREVLEETNIQTCFISIIGFRHCGRDKSGDADLYFVVRLKPTSSSITMDSSELADAAWMPLSEYLTHPLVRPFSREIAKISAQRVANGDLGSELRLAEFEDWPRDSDDAQIYLNHF
ncbi:uncharacterized protein LOC126319956 isoform X1 [Schistocerca gregaria]|uniref:uncharacterized protein LOC126319956 isoform X1 n=1 Tax=Schistocerca gregaria TaxID=7010 RepID=UPI00211F0104|nr:uncharacterized protein LOC126319956 isoform X1 [Schistocerca gregaria]